MRGLGHFDLFGEHFDVLDIVRDLCTANPTLLLFNYLIYYAIISPSKGGRHGYSAERTSVG
jgi:hypothetical protein